MERRRILALLGEVFNAAGFDVGRVLRDDAFLPIILAYPRTRRNVP
jgi:hypothetical protein